MQLIIKKKFSMLKKHMNKKIKIKWTTTTKYQAYIRFYRRLYNKKYKKSYYNVRFASNIIKKQTLPLKHLSINNKNFFQKTKSIFLAKTLTRNIIFSSSNSLIVFSNIWNKFWLTDETEFYIMIIDFLSHDLKWFNFSKKRFIKKKTRNTFTSISKIKRIFQNFFFIYTELAHRLLYKIYFYMFYLKPRFSNEFVVYRLYLTFTTNRLFANLRTSLKSSNNYFSLSLGLFLKFFKKKKSLKKKKLLKILLMKYIRKLFLVVGIVNFEIYVNRTPILLDELLSTLRTATDVKFFDPLSNSFFKDFNKPTLNLLSIKFNTPKAYCLMKGPRKGRLKRKITKRLMRSYRIAD